MLDKHSSERGFKYDCGISGCPKTFTNQQSFRRHVKQKRSWFNESHMIYFKNQTIQSVNANEQENDTAEAEQHHAAMLMQIMMVLKTAV